MFRKFGTVAFASFHSGTTTQKAAKKDSDYGDAYCFHVLCFYELGDLFANQYGNITVQFCCSIVISVLEVFCENTGHSLHLDFFIELHAVRLSPQTVTAQRNSQNRKLCFKFIFLEVIY